MATKKENALAKFLDVSVDEVEPTDYDPNEFEAPGGTWVVLTDAHATRRAKEYILDSLWAFRPEFLESFMPEGIEADTIRSIQEAKYEDATPPIAALVKAGPYSLDKLVEEAIMADGRGHFLAPYDFAEEEQDEYLIYRTN